MKILPGRKYYILLLILVLSMFIYAAINSELTAEQSFNPESEGLLKVHFIDVGDADSILIQHKDKVMLIDAGNDKDWDVINKYVCSQGISRLDILVGTHIHEDHIGSMDSVIEKFDIGKIYIPKCDSTNKYFQDLINAAGKKNLVPVESTPGETFNLGDALCTIMAPNSRGYEKINDYSIVIKLQYGSTSFLFTGDAESGSEREMLRRGYDLSADVLKLGHHGSISSTSNEFLGRVKPQYAVITAGRENNNVHPHKSILKKLKAAGIKVYRTDRKGSIVAVSDGKNITFSVRAEGN